MTRTPGAVLQRGATRDDRSLRNDAEARYHSARAASESLAQPLAPDDYNLQAMADVSPAKWHLAHTTWFFETFLLKPFVADYREFHPQFAYLFNSYYNGVGAQFPRSQRGLLSRPTIGEVYRYRAHVDEAMHALLTNTPEAQWAAIESRAQLGCHHEEQHQELFLTDIKYNLFFNPLAPAYRDDLKRAAAVVQTPLRWLSREGGEYRIGHHGDGFAFDNETPRHRVLLSPHAVASRLVTNGEYLAFLDDGGYRRPELWLSDGWRAANERGWQSPLYWQQNDGGWFMFTLGGLRPLDELEPVCHISYYEADAYARWAGARLPTEAEWEAVANEHVCAGNLREADHLHPVPAAAGDEPVAQMFGDVWEWTQSAYAPYPGYRPASGALGEYNGKFMVNQLVLRGGSCVTPTAHIRASYRNFFYPADRWQFSGLRLARDL